MPYLEELAKELKEKNINLIGIATDSGESEDKKKFAEEVIKEKGVTFTNISPEVVGSFKEEYIPKIMGYPCTLLVDKDGNIRGAEISGVLELQEEKIMKRIDEIISSYK